MSNSQKKAGYDIEEKYFHDVNQKLIESQRKGSQSRALQLRPPGKVIPFPTKNMILKKTG